MTGDPSSDAEDVDATQVDAASQGSSSAMLDAVLARLAANTPPSTTRYTLKGEIARGGMGVILRCHDESLRRPLAMKIIRGDASAADGRSLGRFLEEAQVTAQLDHPGIVPVHELGLDATQRAYFTMKLVKGQDLLHVFDLVHARSEGWNLVRALNVLLRVCEAMSYAHAKGVVHRDLKPANVMVGKFGEVYVMDWGLARVLAAPDTKDLRLNDASSAARSQLRSDRRDESEDPDSPLMTMDGDVVGTPAYMPPEQAEGRLEEVGPHSDVYAVGAMLYHLLTGCMPYVNPGAHVSPRTILAMVLQGPPRPVHELKRDVPAELIAICEKAMARDIAERYASMADLASDLRAYMEQRVVAAHETGAFAELRKWIQRNRALAATGALAVVAALGLASWALLERHTAQARADSVLRLADLKTLDDLRAEQEALWPALPDKAAALAAWLERARELRSRLPLHEATLAALRDSAADDTESRWWHDSLAALVAGLGALEADDPFGATVRSVEDRLAFANGIARRSIADEHGAWQRCIAEVAADPRFAGLALVPQIGLVPLGKDRRSGLQEFWHVASGDRPARDGDGAFLVDERMGIVLVLIPGGARAIGAQATDPAAPNYHALAESDEAPVREVQLDPYLIAKYEMTQGQWLRCTGANPSLYGAHNWRAEWNAAGAMADLAHPVEQVSWDECTTLLARVDLGLPTEAQWETACRAGTDTPWWTGAEPRELDAAGNLADRYGKTHGAIAWTVWEEDLDDGHTTHARVGSFAANAYGLHDMLGNVGEWCSDAYDGYHLPVRAGDGERIVPEATSRVFRGGAFTYLAAQARSAYRDRGVAAQRGDILGCRPARRLATDGSAKE